VAQAGPEFFFAAGPLEDGKGQNCCDPGGSRFDEKVLETLKDGNVLRAVKMILSLFDRHISFEGAIHSGYRVWRSHSRSALTLEIDFQI
jgi:hypothetical protein